MKTIFKCALVGIVSTVMVLSCGGSQKKAKNEVLENLKKVKSAETLPDYNPNKPTLSNPYEGMVLIPGGPFKIGVSSRQAMAYEGPAHTVDIPAFYIDKYEVTVGLFEKFKLKYKPRSYNEGDPKKPALRVDYEEAEKFCAWLGKRLPTEFEWEKAARGTKQWWYPWGDQYTEGKANVGRPFDFGVEAVGSYPPNEYGLYDMCGNAFEWTSSWFDRYPGNNGEDPLHYYGKFYKVFRGGSWASETAEARSTLRHWMVDTHTLDQIGLRCAKDAPAGTK